MTPGQDWPEQARRLAETLRGVLAGAAAHVPADAGAAPECRWCPLRQFVAVLRGERPEVTAALALHGAAPAAVVARVLPDAPGPWATARTAEQEVVLPRLAEVAPVVPVAERATSPVSGDDLAGLLPDGGLPVAPVPAPPFPLRAGQGWELAVALPFAERGAVELTRAGDDLVLTAAGARRPLRLDPLLRRCAVTGGRLDGPGGPGTRLVVRFEPDPDLWPADLLAAHGSTA